MEGKLIVRRLLSRYGARWALGVMLTMLALAQSVGMLPNTLINRVDTFLYDMRMRMQPAVMDSRIVIVNIDEQSLTEVGRWPWSRDVIADLVKQLTGHYRANTVTFDVLFAEPDTSSGYDTLEALARNELKDVESFAQRIETLKPMLDFDGRMAKALKDSPVVLGYYFSNEKNAVLKGLLPDPAFTSTDLYGYALEATTWRAYTANLANLQRSARAGGFMNPMVDEDGVIRRIPLLAQFGDRYYESLSLATIRVALGVEAVRPAFPQPDGVNSKEYLQQLGIAEAITLYTASGALDIPVEPALTVRIPFHGSGGPDGGSFRYLSAADVLKGRVPAAELDQRIVLVGTTVPSLKDLRTAPVGSDYPGVEMHANMIKAILDQDFKVQPDISVGFEVLHIIAVGLMLTVALSALTPLYSILFTVATTAAVSAFNFWMYQSFDMVLPLATTLLLILTLFISNIAWGYLFEYRKGRAIVNLFGEYVAPELVAEMAENPQSYNMEGESRELTVLFADVRGFTTISEGLDPNTLREYINLYLTAMSEDIRGNRGTLDKYIGDAVMAFWGAPIALPDHAARAVATALQMQASAARLNREFVQRGWPELKIGIGLNTGDMRVGDMGSKIRRAYTVMGDAVNLSSRLEGITKVYGVGVVVGEATRLAAPEFAYRELDRVRVKGKYEPVPIFEPIAPATELDDARRIVLAQWHETLALVRAMQWDAAEQNLRQLLRTQPDDGLYVLYLSRIAHFREHPPGTDWDGVTTFETK